MTDQSDADEEHDVLVEQLRYSCDLYAELLSEAERERERRDALIVELVDEQGVSQVAVARLAGLSRTQVNRLLAYSSAV